MKGLSTSLVVVVTAIVILVVALIVITIFTSGINTFRNVAEASNYCSTMAASSCAATGKLPPTWETATFRVYDQELKEEVAKTCATIKGVNVPSGCTK
jgi:hypothetical protein